MSGGAPEVVGDGVFRLDSAMLAQVRGVAGILCDSVKVAPGEKVLIWYDGPRNALIDYLESECRTRGAVPEFFMRDLAKDALLVGQLEPDQIPAYFGEERAKVNAADKIIIVRGPQDPEAITALTPDQAKAYNAAYGEVHARRSDHRVPWVLFFWPTAYEARQENISLREYFEVMLSSVNQDWDSIRAAQDVLIEKLDGAKTLRFVANENDPNPDYRTDISMSVEGMTFVNSTTEANVPGSEVYSAPLVNSVNGQIFAPGDFVYQGHRMSNITVRVHDGKIVSALAESGQAGLDQILSQGEGARFFGEVAIGTNPGLKKRFFNGLLCEKVGGSFHMAIGRCYADETRNGRVSHIDNGNKDTPVHWDITILMHPASGGGRIEADGEIIQQDGVFLDPRLSALNPQHLI